MVKKILKGLGIAAAAVFALGLGYTLADKVVAALPPSANISAKGKQWIASFVAFLSGLAGAVVASRLLGKFLGAGGPSVSASAK
jgi:hypothetical protein